MARAIGARRIEHPEDMLKRRGPRVTLRQRRCRLETGKNLPRSRHDRGEIILRVLEWFLCTWRLRDNCTLLNPGGDQEGRNSDTKSVKFVALVGVALMVIRRGCCRRSDVIVESSMLVVCYDEESLIPLQK